ncbi:MAG: hypothetical protein ACTSPS_20255 [Promethearchaeota archaeon]
MGCPLQGCPNASRDRRDMYCSSPKTGVTLGLIPSKSTRVPSPAHR